MASQHLKLVGSQPKTNARREKDSERYRVKSFLTDVLLKEDRAHEILEIGGTWERRPEIKRVRNPRVSRSASAPVSPYGADDRISRIESKVESLSNTVDKLVKSLGGV